MADDKITRFLSGVITRARLKEPSGKNSTYSIHLEGAFEDTGDEFDGYLSSKYPVRVYEGKQEEPIDPAETDGIKFMGRAMIVQCNYEDRDEPFNFLQAVSIEERIGEDDSLPDESNPFLANPL